MKVSFVIPSWNNFHLVNQLLVDIKDHCTPDEIIVVDDCSNDEATLNGLSWWAENFNIKLLRPVENLGFLRASNYGMKQATGDVICLISTDIRIEDDLVKIVKYCLEKDSKILIGGILYSHDTGWNTFDNKTYNYLEGWLLCCLKSSWEDLGGFDERFAPSDMEDVDLSATALQKGYKLIPLNNPKIRHIGGQTIGYTDERMAMTIKHKEIFRQKWTTQQEQQQTQQV